MERVEICYVVVVTPQHALPKDNLYLALMRVEGLLSLDFCVVVVFLALAAVR